MTGPERIIIDPQGAVEPQTGEPPVDILRTVTWLVLGFSLIGDLALTVQQASSSLRLQFGLVTVISVVALAGQYARR
jgi:hypothetical protein